MPMLIDFQCPRCGEVREGFKGKKIWCSKCSYFHPLSNGEIVPMQPIFSPKQNGQRWRFKDGEQ